MPAKGGNENVIELLKQDHRDVERLFEQFEKAENENEKMAIAERICLMLQVHTQLEEELFYPAIRGKIEDDMVDEAVVEHGSAKQLMEQIQAAEAGDEMFEAQVKVLQEQIEHHVEEEEQEMFPEVEKSGVDLNAIGRKLIARKAELMGEVEGDLDDSASQDADRPQPSR